MTQILPLKITISVDASEVNFSHDIVRPQTGSDKGHKWISETAKIKLVNSIPFDVEIGDPKMIITSVYIDSKVTYFA